MAPPEAFAPIRPATVVVPYFEAPRALSLTLAALEGQTYPRDLFEVVVVDDGSRVPLERPRPTPLDVRVVRQEYRGFGLARARNAGARAAAHDILLFLDGDMLPEAGWLAAHARWHHAAGDLLTQGFYSYVAVDGMDARAVRERPGTLRELFADLPLDPSFIGAYLARTRDLTSRDDDPFGVVSGGNFGIGRAFFDLVGGFDESFTRWGLEDTEFAWRVCNRGGVVVPVREAFAWHQGRYSEDRARKDRSHNLQRAKVAHLIAHEDFRDARAGRFFAVPRFVVTLDADDTSAARIAEAVETVLADRVPDLVVRIELPADDARRERLRDRFGPDPRVRIGPRAAALDEFPAAPFHIALPAGVRFARSLVYRLYKTLGPAAIGTAALPGGSQVSIARAWALHRARRTGRRATEFGDAKAMSARTLRLSDAPAPRAGRRAVPEWRRLLQSRTRKVLARMMEVRTPREAWWFLTWLVRKVGRLALRLAGRPGGVALRRRFPTAAGTFDGAGGDRPLGAEIACLGPRSQAVFRSARREMPGPGRGHVDVVVADTPAAAEGVEAPVVALSQAPATFSVPAVDSCVDNPVRWPRDVAPVVAALGPLDRLPPGVAAHRVVHGDNRRELRWAHHVEDVQGFHRNPIERAGTLVRLAAAGVVVHLADSAPELREMLGAELHGLMATDMRSPDLALRESLSIRMRRAALREHSLQSRARQICEAALPDPPLLPLVSVLLVTRRPRLLSAAVAAVARQTYPRLELVLGLHGEGFDDAESCVAGLGRLSGNAKIVRIDGRLPLGSALNAAAEASGGTLLAKMDDDDVYGVEHIWDLVLAHEYSGAQLVGKGLEFAYLARLDLTLRWSGASAETELTDAGGGIIAGGATLIARRDLDRVGGWRRMAAGEDRMLIADIVRTGGRVYQTHGADYVYVRHGRGHAWEAEDSRFLKDAETVRKGWDPALASLEDMPLPAASAAGGDIISA